MTFPANACVRLAVTFLLACNLTASADVPATLPKPDGKPGDAAKPVKVYILAGQSNMIGFGAISGAAPRYAAFYLTSDPAAPAGVLPFWGVGEFGLGRCSVFAADGTKTDTPVASGLLEVPVKGVYRVHCGFGETANGTMTIDGKEVYRRAADGAPTVVEIALEAQARGDRPARTVQLLPDAIDGLADLYRAAGIPDYDWHVFGKDLRDVEWDVFSFDPPKTLPKEKSGRSRKVTLPAGMEEWFTAGFDAAKAGKAIPPRGHFTVWIEEQKLPPMPATNPK